MIEFRKSQTKIRIDINANISDYRLIRSDSHPGWFKLETSDTKLRMLFIFLFTVILSKIINYIKIFKKANESAS